MSTHSMPPVAVLGTGVAGLTAALALQQAGIPVVAYEASSRIAGLATTFKDPDGFSYDFGAHFITNRFAKAVGVESQCQDVRYYGESVLLKGRTYSYPMGLTLVPRFALSAAYMKITRRAPSPWDGSVADAFSHQYGTALTQEEALPLIEAWSGEPGTRLSAAVAEKIPAGLLHVLALKFLSACTKKAIA